MELYALETTGTRFPPTHTHTHTHLHNVILSFLLSSCVHVFIYFIPFILVLNLIVYQHFGVCASFLRNTIFNMNPIENRTQYMNAMQGVVFNRDTHTHSCDTAVGLLS